MIKQIQTHATGGDACAPYDVKFDKPHTVGELVSEVLTMRKEKCSIHVFMNGYRGGMDYNLSDNKDIHEIIRKGMTDALEKRIEELKAEFESL